MQRVGKQPDGDVDPSEDKDAYHWPKSISGTEGRGRENRRGGPWGGRRRKTDDGRGRWEGRVGRMGGRRGRGEGGDGGGGNGASTSSAAVAVEGVPGSMTVVQLRAALEARGLPKAGLKGELVARLEEAQRGERGSGGDGAAGGAMEKEKREKKRQSKVSEEEEEEEEMPEEVGADAAREGARKFEEGAAKAVRAAERKAKKLADAKALVRKAERDVAQAAREAKEARRAAREAAEQGDEEEEEEEEFLPASVTAAVARAQADGAIRPVVHGPKGPSAEELALQRTLRRREKRRRTKEAARRERVVGRFRVVNAGARLAGTLGDDARGVEGAAAADAFRSATLFNPGRNNLVGGNLVKFKYGAKRVAPAADF